MAVYLENYAVRYMVGIYFECRKNKTYPSPGSWGQQTAYCIELFEFIDSLCAQSNRKNHDIAMAKAKSKNKK